MPRPKKPKVKRTPPKPEEGSTDVVLEYELLEVGEVAAVLGLSKKSVFELAASGQMPPPIRFSPRCLRWRRSELVRWIKEK